MATAPLGRAATQGLKRASPWAALTSTKTLTRADVEEAISYATAVGLSSRAAGPWRDPRLKPHKLDILGGRVLATLFFEPSTRTSSSFAAAMLRMGGSVLNLNMANSSGKKGETLSDTIRVMGEYADALVIRHPDVDVFEQIGDAHGTVPLINAGNGADEHPTQALLDMLTLKTELGTLDGLTVTIVGDLKHGRTVHSLTTLLSKFEGVTLNLVAPTSLALPAKWMGEIRANSPHMLVRELESYREVIKATDVLYMTRVQQERFDSREDYDAVKGGFELTANDLKGSRALVLHPLPRVNEISPCVDQSRNACYFEQVGYGVAMRMALLGLAMGEPPPFAHVTTMDRGD